jgi:type II restriction/modification system DNA methylase subunit YeeA
MTPDDFISKWRAGGDERRDAQPFFEDICRLIGHPTPREADPEHGWFTYEYGADKTSGGKGWADVWKKGFFGWEAKGTHKNLERAYEQLKMYADALENPPLLVVSDLRQIVIHTNFTNSIKRVIQFTVEDLRDLHTRRLLSAVFNDPDSIRPGVTRTVLTQEAAQRFSALAQTLRDRGHESRAVAHFLNRLLFSMFSEDIGLLPNQLFTKLVEGSQGKPDLFDRRCRDLFAAMNKGGDVAFETVDWFNGGLFDDDSTLPVTAEDLKSLLVAAKMDWSDIEPSIFGTLFERGLDPEKRSQLGAHYTDPNTIMKIVSPVVSEPWLRAWQEERASLIKLIHSAERKADRATQERVAEVRRRAENYGGAIATASAKPAASKVPKAARDRFNKFLESFRNFTILDPACGSGNFLYLGLRALKDVEKRVLIEAEALGLGRQFPMIGPSNVRGIEINAYAAELARITIWIGEIQWMIQNGYGAKKDPILQKLDRIENRDAVLADDGTKAQWPAVDAVIGNPPFVGDKKMLRELGDDYVARLRAAYRGKVPGGADLVAYWFSQALELIEKGNTKRVGLVTTQSIRAGASRVVLDQIVKRSNILNAWSDEEWINDGAAVRVSMVCFGEGTRAAVTLDGAPVAGITSSLTASGSWDRAQLLRLKKNRGVAFQGPVKVGSFEVPGDVARVWLALPLNANGRPNSDVVRPWANGSDVVRRPSDTWIIDFGHGMDEKTASFYEAPFAYVKENVKAMREAGRRENRKRYWWLHGETVPAFRKAVAGISRYIATPRVAKHRLFVWLDKTVLPDSRLYAIVRDDEATFGVLHSRVHEVWSLANSSRHGVGNDPTYNAASCFETFPFPMGIGPGSSADSTPPPSVAAVCEAAKALVDARAKWLNPDAWVVRRPEVVAGFPDQIIPQPTHRDELKKRTLTNLYNLRPDWLRHLHDALDVATATAYGWEWPLADDEILFRLSELNARPSNK